MGNGRLLQTLEQRRSAHAAEQLQPVLEMAAEERKELAAEVKSLAVKIRINGLCATIAYLTEKSSKNERRKDRTPLVEALESWLVQSPDSPIRWEKGADAGSLAVRITKCSATQFAILTDEALAYAAWLKRWMNAFSS